MIGVVHMKKESITRTLIKNTLLSSVTIIAVFIFFTLISLNQIGESRLKQQEATLKNNFDLMVKRQVQSAISILEVYNRKVLSGELTKEEAVLQAADIVRHMNYGDGNYYFVYNSKGVIVIDRGSKLEGGNEFDFVDLKGNYYAREIINNGKKEIGGYSEYYFSKPGSNVPLAKRSYSIYFEPFDWVVGTGNYIEDINEIFSETDTVRTIKDQNNMMIWLMIGIGVFVLFISILLSLRASLALTKTQKNLHTAEELLEKDLMIKEIKNRLEKSIGSAPIGYAVTIDGKLLEENNYMDEKFAMKVNQPVRDVHLDPLESDGIQEEIARGETIAGRTVLLKTLRDGVQRFQLSMNFVEYDNTTAAISWLVSIEEVEAQKDALRLAEKGLQKIVDTLPIPMLIVDKANHEILYANHASSYLFPSIDAETGETHKLTNFVEMYGQHKEMQDGNINFEVGLKYQEKIDLLVSASEIVYRNEDSIIFICQNISAQKKQSELLLKAAEKEREANQMKSMFLANMSHEIRTPMNAIIGFSQILISDKTLAAKQKEFVHSINKSGEHLLTLINDVLEMSKIEAGSITYSPSTIDMFALIAELKNMFILRTNSKGISFVVEHDELTRYIFSDESKIRQITLNLLSNAVKFTNTGSISWKLKCADGDADAESLLVIEISDTGIGISAEELETIFEPFKQSESGKKNGGGTGLGLSISRELARFMGGDIFAESEYGVGTTFRTEIPVQISDAHGVTEIETVQNVISIKGGKCPRILVVDDKLENILVLRELLQPIGFIVSEARDGKEAIDIFESEQFDLILMDMRMPVMDGYEASIKIRKSEINSRIPIVALTASAFEEDKQRIFDVGIDDYVRKPFQRKILFNAIKRNLHIEYIYDDDAVEEVVIKDTDMSFQAVPAALSERLAEAVDMADFNEALDVLDLMREFLLIGEYNLIKSLIDSFQYEKVAEILSRTMASES